MKIVWRVSPRPTGSFASFHRRGWPSASFGVDGDPAAHIMCEDDYRPAQVKAGTHAELSVRVADYTVTPFVWRRLKARYKTLEEAKLAVVAFFQKYPQLMPQKGQKP